MKIELILTAEEIEEKKIKNRVVAAIDTFRATTTIVTALENGAREVIPVVSIPKAVEYQSQNINDDIITAGEREGQKVAELDLGNSPLSFTESIVKNKQVVLTTTNGTEMLANLNQAKKVVIAALINLGAVAKEVESADELILCCAGSQGRFSLEDFITAGGLIYRLKDKGIKLELSDLSLVAYQSYLINSNKLLATLSQSENGDRLISLGKQSDVNYALQKDLYSITPIYCQGIIQS
ncbi:2-phosphosulfolactate phosphatase [Acetohalobium arabaticum]|uniref:Probable 2-phosphosulfolactate phosphatase n=1 Tax=Acetohalobium arabaticum (strain ATCC 49924 / DSM 5501 / Z-7288) TaxID=574087 RepID=D9QQR4_ACEAZ|nr:2-phosphosulfolactate phosphatase [Acetohalobium arabaticum]ADL12855.1 2-phosphosulfolactate phosphatase [Acetohalobium arabaticum DSM 5501]